jgi:hypothetical protein
MGWGYKVEKESAYLDWREMNKILAEMNNTNNVHYPRDEWLKNA